MTQKEIASAISTVFNLLPSSGNGETMDTQAWAEYHKQQAVFDQTCEELCQRVRQADDKNLFDVLFPLACSRSEPLYGMENFAAHILFYLNLACPISCADAIRKVSQSNWDVSLCELPWYLAVLFGTDKVYQILDELEQEDDVQASLAELTAWRDAHYFTGMKIAQWEQVHKAEPRADVYQNLHTIRYWLDIFVRTQENLLANWEPLWRWHVKGAEQSAV